MSRKLVAQVKDIKGLSGRHKRVLEAWAAFANNDGTNIFASKESVADKASISKWTVFRNTDDLIEVGVLVEADRHVCRESVKPQGKCDGGAWHYAGNGHYTRAYNISVAELQNATQLCEKLDSKMLLGLGSKMPKSKVAKSHATQTLDSTPAPLSKNQDSSALTSGRNEGMKEAATLAQGIPQQEQKPEAQGTLPPNQDQPQEQSQPEQDTEETQAVRSAWQEHVGLPFRYSHDGIMDEVRDAKNLIDRHGLEAVLSYVHDTFACPKTAKVSWRDFSYWAAEDNFDLTRRNIDAWRRTKKKPAAPEAKPTNPNCSRCKGPTYGSPTWEDDKPYCGDCMKLPPYRRHSGERALLTATVI